MIDFQYKFIDVKVQGISIFPTHNLKVGGSSPPPATYVRMPEWSKGVVCKTIFHRFKSDSSLYGKRFLQMLCSLVETFLLYYPEKIIELVPDSGQYFIQFIYITVFLVLFYDSHSCDYQVVVFVRNRGVGYRVIRIGIPVIFVIIDLYGGVIS